ncbi:MAG TPA: hypothetical protein VFB90_08285 [Dehalococcoidia bacterium]|nr:hypothetical protein [Dehalococcoidia bacterium]
MSRLSEVYGHPAVKRFGQAYRRALRDPSTQDYASLIDLENAETEERLAEAVRRFLRRNHKTAQDKNWFWPGDQQLEEVMKLAEENVVLVRAAIESYALLWEPRSEREATTQGEQS